jgi:hypothetical protein
MLERRLIFILEFAVLEVVENESSSFPPSRQTVWRICVALLLGSFVSGTGWLIPEEDLKANNPAFSGNSKAHSVDLESSSMIDTSDSLIFTVQESTDYQPA